MGGGKGGGGPSQAEVLAGQRQLQQESFAMQEQAALRAEERAAERREQERLEELERRRTAELERAEAMRAEELREQGILAEAEAGQSQENESTIANLNLDAPQIEQPDYAERTELE